MLESALPEKHTSPPTSIATHNTPPLEDVRVWGERGRGGISILVFVEKQDRRQLTVGLLDC